MLLLQQLTSPQANSVISPFSVDVDLIMAGSGAKGKTFNEIRKTLDLSGNINSIASDYKTLLDPLYVPASVLKVGNGVYVQTGLTINSAYSDLLTTNYHTTVKSLDFNDPQAAADVINGDVSTATDGLITDIIQAATLSALTEIVLVNSVYFKNSWSNPFNADLTQSQSFYSIADKSNSIQVPTMQQTVSSTQFLFQY